MKKLFLPIMLVGCVYAEQDPAPEVHLAEKEYNRAVNYEVEVEILRKALIHAATVAGQATHAFFSTEEGRLDYQKIAWTTGGAMIGWVARGRISSMARLHKKMDRALNVLENGGSSKSSNKVIIT